MIESNKTFNMLIAQQTFAEILKLLKYVEIVNKLKSSFYKEIDNITFFFDSLFLLFKR